jgi:predicted nucleic acid-binding protein
VREPLPLPRAVLDSNVVFSRVLYELFGRLALEGRLLDLVWSEELLAEASWALQRRKGLDAKVAGEWVGRLQRAFSEGRTDPGRLSSGVDLSALTVDPDDEFVCATAISGGAQLLVTVDRGYLHEPLRRLGVSTVHPDAWLAAAAADEPALFADVLRRQAAVWGGGRPVIELLEAFERAALPAFVERARDLVPRGAPS